MGTNGNKPKQILLKKKEKKKRANTWHMVRGTMGNITDGQGERLKATIEVNLLHVECPVAKDTGVNAGTLHREWEEKKKCKLVSVPANSLRTKINN